ncbi:hypothetical protein ADUPG1_011458, partial [Aduncisulcus paluster]
MGIIKCKDHHHYDNVKLGKSIYADNQFQLRLGLFKGELCSCFIYPSIKGVDLDSIDIIEEVNENILYILSKDPSTESIHGIAYDKTCSLRTYGIYNSSMLKSLSLRSFGILSSPVIPICSIINSSTENSLVTTSSWYICLSLSYLIFVKECNSVKGAALRKKVKQHLNLANIYIDVSHMLESILILEDLGIFPKGYQASCVARFLRDYSESPESLMNSLHEIFFEWCSALIKSRTSFVSDISKVFRLPYLDLRNSDSSISDFVQDGIDEFDKEYREFCGKFLKKRGKGLTKKQHFIDLRYILSDVYRGISSSGQFKKEEEEEEEEKMQITKKQEEPLSTSRVTLDVSALSEDIVKFVLSKDREHVPTDDSLKTMFSVALKISFEKELKGSSGVRKGDSAPSSDTGAGDGSPDISPSSILISSIESLLSSPPAPVTNTSTETQCHDVASFLSELLGLFQQILLIFSESGEDAISRDILDLTCRNISFMTLNVAGHLLVKEKGGDVSAMFHQSSFNIWFQLLTYLATPGMFPLSVRRYIAIIIIVLHDNIHGMVSILEFESSYILSLLDRDLPLSRGYQEGVAEAKRAYGLDHQWHRSLFESINKVDLHHDFIMTRRVLEKRFDDDVSAYPEVNWANAIDSAIPRESSFVEDIDNFITEAFKGNSLRLSIKQYAMLNYARGIYTMNDHLKRNMQVSNTIGKVLGLETDWFILKAFSSIISNIFCVDGPPHSLNNIIFREAHLRWNERCQQEEKEEKEEKEEESNKTAMSQPTDCKDYSSSSPPFSLNKLFSNFFLLCYWCTSIEPCAEEDDKDYPPNTFSYGYRLMRKE